MFSVFMAVSMAEADSVTSLRSAGAVALPTLAVQGSTGTSGGYKADNPTLPKLTEPLVNTPQSIDVVPRQVLDDQGVTNFRDALRNVPGISLAAGEAASQGDSLGPFAALPRVTTSISTGCATSAATTATRSTSRTFRY